MSEVTDHPADELRPGDRLAVGIDGVAQLLDVSVWHVSGLDTRGVLPEAVRLGKSKRWSVAELRAWLAAGCPARERWASIKTATK